MLIAAFRARFPEFRSASDTLVQAVLDEAAGQLDADIFGAKYDAAHGYLTAHLLATSTFGRSQRLASDDGTSIHLANFEDIKRQVARRIIVI